MMVEEQLSNNNAFPSLMLPSFANTAWVVETSPEETSVWLSTLPMADAPQTAQVLYQALFTLNRMSLNMNTRLQLMELYRTPVTTVVTGLRNRLQSVSLPLRPRLKQLADFLVLLLHEMSYGYKRILKDTHHESRPEDNDALLLAVARGIESLGGVLLQTYHVYQPSPVGVWKEIHGLYRYAEHHRSQHQPLSALNQGEPLTVARTYLQVLMLGLCNPYQLPPGECLIVKAFLDQWAERTTLTENIEGTDPLGHFLLDLDADHPASPFPRDVSVHDQPALRAINAIELARVAHDFARRLQKGELLSKQELGFECVRPGCLETLKRMMRFWGLAARRQFSRRERRQTLSLCVGLPAVHFFVSGQQQLSSSGLQGGSTAVVPSQAELDAEVQDNVPAAAPVYRLDNRWQLRDESASGMLLSRSGDLGPFVHVGDLVGIHDPEGDRWRLGVVRWVKSPDSRMVEMGMEMLAPSTQALQMRSGGIAKMNYEPVLWVPPVPALRRPALLLAAHGTLRDGEDIELVDAHSDTRIVRILSIAERSSSFVQAVFADKAR